MRGALLATSSSRRVLGVDPMSLSAQDQDSAVALERVRGLE